MEKTLTVTDEAYERLASRKEPGESFTTVINKLTGKTSLFDIVGVLSNKEAEELRENIKERRKKTRSRMDAVAKRLQGGSLR